VNSNMNALMYYTQLNTMASFAHFAKRWKKAL